MIRIKLSSFRRLASDPPLSIYSAAGRTRPAVPATVAYHGAKLICMLLCAETIKDIVSTTNNNEDMNRSVTTVAIDALMGHDIPEGLFNHISQCLRDDADRFTGDMASKRCWTALLFYSLFGPHTRIFINVEAKLPDLLAYSSPPSTC